MDGIIGEVLNLFKVPPEYRLPAIIVGLLIATLLVGLYRRFGYWLEWLRQQNFEQIDVQLNTITTDRAGYPQLRWMGVGKLKLKDVAEWAHLAHLVRRAAARTTVYEPWVVLETAQAHSQFMGQLLSAAGALPALILHAQANGNTSFTAMLVSEDYPGIPARLKLFLIDSAHLNASTLENLGLSNVETPNHLDRAVTWRRAVALLNPNRAYLGAVRIKKCGWRHLNIWGSAPLVTVIHTLRVSVPKDAPSVQTAERKSA